MKSKGASGNTDMVLEVLQDHPGSTTKELALRTGLGYSTVGKLLAGLESNGRAERGATEKARQRLGRLLSKTARTPMDRTV